MNAPLSKDAAYTTVREDIADLVPMHALRVLDLGCSNGTLGRHLRRRQPGQVVWGVEFDPAYAEQAASVLDHAINANLDSDEWRQAIGSQRFDCIVMADVLEHLADPARCLAHACELLSAGGCVVVSLPNIRHVSALWSIFLRGRFPRRERGLFDRTHLRWFTFGDGVALMQAAGLEVQAVDVGLRVGDRGGGPINRRLNRLPAALRQWAPLREFLGYQFALRAVKLAGAANAKPAG